MRNGLRLLTAAAVLSLPPAAAAHGFEYGDPVPILRGDRFDVREASSGPGHGTALHVWDADLDARERRRAALPDAAGRWHRFTAAGEPERVRLAQLDGGAGLVAWRDDSGAVDVRTWSRDGTLAAARPVIANARRWALSAD